MFRPKRTATSPEESLECMKLRFCVQEVSLRPAQFRVNVTDLQYTGCPLMQKYHQQRVQCKGRSTAEGERSRYAVLYNEATKTAEMTRQENHLWCLCLFFLFSLDPCQLQQLCSNANIFVLGPSLI
jgi:hypothetical protein